MIHKLNKTNFRIVEHLMSEVKNFPEIHAVISSVSPGEIYVDNNKNPKSALIWNQGMQGFYFIGQVNNASFKKNIKDYVDNKLIIELLDKGINWFEVSATCYHWEDVIEEIFEDKKIQFDYQLVYQMNENADELTKDLRSGEFNIKKLDKKLLVSTVSNLEFVTNELELFWGTMDNFFNNGTCYFAMENNEIVSVCYSGFVANGTETIGIETLSGYRKKGYAYELASRFIKDCFERKIIPYWDCSKDNIASRKLAEKLGFEQSEEYKCYWFKF